jgi:transcriptional regulator with XRE-family HTH domain
MNVQEHVEKTAAIKSHWRMTLAEISKHSGLSVGWISRYLKGKHDNPTHKTTERIDNALAAIVEERKSMPVSGNTKNADARPGHPHNGLDGLVHEKSIASTPEQNDTDCDDGPVQGTVGGQSS